MKGKIIPLILASSVIWQGNLLAEEGGPPQGEGRTVVASLHCNDRSGDCRAKRQDHINRSSQTSEREPKNLQEVAMNLREKVSRLEALVEDLEKEVAENSAEVTVTENDSDQVVPPLNRLQLDFAPNFLASESGLSILGKVSFIFPLGDTWRMGISPLAGTSPDGRWSWGAKLEVRYPFLGSRGWVLFLCPEAIYFRDEGENPSQDAGLGMAFRLEKNIFFASAGVLASLATASCRECLTEGVVPLIGEFSLGLVVPGSE